MKICIFILLFVFSSLPYGKTQVIAIDLGLQFGTSVNLNYNVGKKPFKENFPGIKVFVGAFAQNKLKFIFNEKSERNAGLFTISTCVALYNKSLGNSLNLLYQDNQIDWTSSISLGWVKDATTYTKALQSINNTPFYNLIHQYTYATFLGVNFIMNNHRRNQTVGSFSATIGDFSFNYYNDGGSVLNLGFGDAFDRWWTGGLGLYFHNNHGYNTLEANFDQFTGYSKQLFDFSEIFGLDITSYDVYENIKKDSLGYSVNSTSANGYNFNSSQLQFRFFFDKNYGVSAGILGSLRDEADGYFYALQDMIHIARRNPIHPNKDINRIFIGAAYYNFKNQ